MRGTGRNGQVLAFTLRLWSYLLLAFTALWSGLGALTYVTGDPGGFDPLFRAKYIAHLGLVWCHGVSSVAVLVLGPLQLLRLPRAVHRVGGLLLLLGVAVGGVSGLAMGLMANGGPVARTGFVAMALVWLLCGWRCWEARRSGPHRLWGLRLYAVTLSAVLIRVGLDWLQEFGFFFDDIYRLAAWLSWLVPLGLVEVWNRR